MLVLTRKAQERIVIGDNITVSILKIKGNTVRVGIEAPRDVHVVRAELPRFEVEIELEGEAETESDSESSGPRSMRELVNHRRQLSALSA